MSADAFADLTVVFSRYVMGNAEPALAQDAQDPVRANGVGRRQAAGIQLLRGGAGPGWAAAARCAASAWVSSKARAVSWSTARRWARKPPPAKL